MTCFIRRFLPVLLCATSLHAAEIEPKDPFDRLDGTGPSKMNVRVVDWEGNIELQISPMHLVKSLGFRFDRKTDKNKPVLVIEYQWTHLPFRQIRRALLTNSLKEGFQIYYDASYGDRDRYVLTNQVPDKKNLAPFKPGPEPTQLWPDHHENVDSATPSAVDKTPQIPEEGASFEPFSTDTKPNRVRPPDVDAEAPRTYTQKRPAAPGVQLQQGSIETDSSEAAKIRKRLQDDHADDLRQGFDF